MKSIFLALIWLFYAAPAFAYLDPATGSILLGFVSAILSAMVISFEKLKRAIWLTASKTKKQSRKNSQDQVLIHSEGPAYLTTFEPLAKSFQKSGFDFSIICSTDREAEAYSRYSHAKVIRAKPVEMYRKISKSKASLFVTTTPGLDILSMRRSALFRKCIYLSHSPCDVHTYAPYSFDHFDVLMWGQAQKRSIRKLESLRGNSGTKRKTVLSTGLVYSDAFFQDKTKAPLKKEAAGLLIAPSWGKTSMLYQFNRELLEKLSKRFEKISFRFHPQSYKSDNEKVNEIRSAIDALPNAEINQSPSPHEAILDSSAMLTEVSGIIFDFKLLNPNGRLYYYRPAHTFEGKEGHWLPWDPIELNFAKRFGTDIDDFSRVDQILQSHSPKSTVSLDQIPIDFVGSAADQSASAIMKIWQDL